MNRTVRLREEADRDLAAAASWYEQQRAGLGHEFLDDALLTFRLISEQPLKYPVVHRGTRRALITRFPFGVYFRVEESQLVVVAESMAAVIHIVGKAAHSRCFVHFGPCWSRSEQ